jgi:predicted CoA-binding protein
VPTDGLELKHRMLRESRTIAVVGLSQRPDRDSHQVARYLIAQGYRVIPVNPLLEEVLGETCYPSVSAIPEAVDLVDVFRRSEFAPAAVEDALAAGVGRIWLQDGVVSEPAAGLARAAGVAFVMDDCTMRVHRRMPRASRG